MKIGGRRPIEFLRRATAWGREKVPPGARTALGIVLVAAGVFGFLPILGFWMIPVGCVLIALDIPPLRRRLRTWLDQKSRDKEKS